MELQTILLSSLEASDADDDSMDAVQVCRDIPERSSAPVNLAEQDLSQKWPRLVSPIVQQPQLLQLPDPSPPVRAMNPIILNSPFNRESEDKSAVLPTSRTRIRKSEFKKDKNRIRAASWPGNNQLIRCASFPGKPISSSIVTQT